MKKTTKREEEPMSFEIEIPTNPRFIIESRWTAAGERQVVIDTKTRKVLGIYKTFDAAYERWEKEMR